MKVDKNVSGVFVVFRWMDENCEIHGSMGIGATLADVLEEHEILSKGLPYEIVSRDIAYRCVL